MPSPIVGTWHANGFYGNFRSRCRSDFTQEYRKAARPPPPDRFLQRMKETPSKHIFSKHDNRHAFPGSAMCFENGLGRKRIEGSLPSTLNLIDWIPLKEELQRERPLVSSYQADYRSRDKLSQRLVPRDRAQRQPLHRTPSTTYQHTYRSYCLRDPILGVLKEQGAKDPEPDAPAPATSSEPTGDPTPSTPPTGNAARSPDPPAPGRFYRRCALLRPVRLTVSDCLHWYNC
ncbi:ciliary microtubule inner protein 7 isoform X2 [Paroedura picta]|uniref:ciliary microtubule inner protein 7 isoform X2 n=1 Tax=Paroedura picta TaxID=143630 RepID=UPI004055D0BC